MERSNEVKPRPAGPRFTIAYLPLESAPRGIKRYKAYGLPREAWERIYREWSGDCRGEAAR